MHKRISANNFRMINLETQYPPLELFTFRVALHVNIKKKLLACKTTKKVTETIKNTWNNMLWSCQQMLQIFTKTAKKFRFTNKSLTIPGITEMFHNFKWQIKERIHRFVW